MVSHNVHTVVSTAAAERRNRIEAFKAKVSSLRATSKAYNFDCDASIDTLDSLTTAGSSYVAAAAETTIAALPESPNSERRDNSEEVPAPDEITRRKNPFMDSPGDDSEEESIIINEFTKVVDPLSQVRNPVSSADKTDINEFKEKMSTLRAISKEYHFRSDISLNTLDSVSTDAFSKEPTKATKQSVASSSSCTGSSITGFSIDTVDELEVTANGEPVEKSNNEAQLRIRNMLDRSRDVLNATDQSSTQSSTASDEVDSFEGARKIPFVGSEDELTIGLKDATNPFLDSEDEASSTDQFPSATNPFLESDDEASTEKMPNPPKPATNLLMKKVETLNEAPESIHHEEQEASVDKLTKSSKHSVASSSSYTGSSITGFSIDTIDELEVTTNDEPVPEKTDEPVKKSFPFAQLLAMRQANKAAAKNPTSLSEVASQNEQETNKVADAYDVHIDNSFEGAVFNEIKKTLFQIDSVSYETEASAEEKVEEMGLPSFESDDDEAKASSILKSSPESDKGNVDAKVVTSNTEHVDGADEEKSATDDSADTQTCSNSQKFDYLATKDRNTTLTPPKKDVVLSDDSISTKNSIFGRVISVANHDLVAERIYYESLRAQYHAELKVHVADEEIRLALDARLKAIQDFYKKKGNVAQIQECYGEEYQQKVASIPKVKPVVIQEVNDATDEPSPLQSPPLQSPSSSPRHETHKFAFERAQDGIDEAIKAAHVAAQVEPVNVQIDDIIQKEEPTSDVPETIFTNESFWNEGVEQPSTAEEELKVVEESLYKTHSKTVVNAWFFYRDINELLFESRRYDYEFNALQKDPLYPYLNSLVGIADSGDDGFINENKRIKQENKRDYANKSPIRICHSLTEDAEAAMPKLKEICIDIGTKLSMTTFAVGPTKKAAEALAKCTNKYGGDPLLVTDYCRVSMFTKDIATLLAVMEILLTKYKDKVRRIKLSSLRFEHAPLAGGYRDCKVNIDVDGHICEIQLHLEQLWNIKEGKGYAHYKACKANDVDCTTFDIEKTLSGLDRKFMTQLVKVGTDATKKFHLEDLHSGNEESIRDYYALACIYLKKGKGVDYAEKVLSRLVKIRSESLIFGPRHDETLLFMKKHHECLKRLHKFKSASLIEARIEKTERLKAKNYDPTLSDMCMQDQCGALEYICDVFLDPSSVEKEKIERQNEVVEESRALWLSLRKTYWSLNQPAATTM